MDFFQHQDQARKNTRLLIIFFLLAVLSLIAITTAFVSALLYYFKHHNQQGYSTLQSLDGQYSSLPAALLNWEVTGTVALAVISVVAAGSFYRMLQLRSGGDSIAAALGGSRLQPNSKDPDERRLLNVVEEMAIASGTPVPAVYLLEEAGINAFAAGHDSRDAVIGVTRGCMERLNREQLQGVVAHEFSHILHGDMGINLRLLGVLHGILVIGLLGSVLLRSGSYGSGSGFRIGRRRDKNSSGLVLVGLGLVVIGYAGTFFGNLIKAAVSRQREFLADAAAVQFTRNPRGISEALQKIGGYSAGSRLTHPSAEEFSHMYFGAGVRAAFGGMMATHPPLPERIRRLTPGWNGQFAQAPAQPADNSASAYTGNIAAAAAVSQVAAAATANSPADTLDSVANPGAEHLQQAAATLAQLPAGLREAAREPFSARAIIYNLLIAAGADADSQWQQLERRAHPAVNKIARQLQPHFDGLPASDKLPLFELTIPALKTLSQPQYSVFQENVVALIKTDRKVAVFEWAVYRMLINALEPRTSNKTANTRLTYLGVPIQQLLSTLSHSGHKQEASAESAYNAAMGELGLANLPLLPQAHLSLQLLDSALSQLQSLRPLQKPMLLKALLTCIRHDQHISASEYELFRAVADCLDCPIPPLL